MGYDTSDDDKPSSSTVDDNEAAESYESEEETNFKKTSIVGTIFNMINSILGAGILSIGNCFIPTGYVVSIILLLLIAFLSYVASIMIVKLSADLNVNGLSELANVLTGKVGSISLSILNLLYLITGLIVYLVLAGDTLESWFKLGGHDYSSRYKRALMILIYSVIPISLTIPRQISFLKYFSTATVICILFYLVSNTYKFSDYVHGNKGVNPTTDVVLCKFDIFSSFATYGVAFALPAVIMPSLRMYEKSLSKRMRATFIAILLAFIFVTLSGVTSYSIFGTSTKSNILNNYSDNDKLVIAIRAGFFIVVTSAYPMLSQSVISAWGFLIFRVENSRDLETKKRVLLLVLCSLIPLIIAMFLPTIKPAISVGGALGGVFTDFFYPPLFWIIHHKNDYSKFDYRRILCIIFMVFGLITAVISTYQAVVNAIDSFKKDE